MTARDADVEATFLEAIRTNPDDDDARGVYADWLDERGDPRGEYLRLEVQLVHGPARLAQLAAAIPPTWLGAVQRRFRLMLIAAPQKIAAIKVVRELTGIGLKEAKDLVESPPPVLVLDDLSSDQAREYARRFIGAAEVEIMPRIIPMPPPPPQPIEAEPSFTLVLLSVVPKRHLHVIKRVREVTPLGLKVARDLVTGVIAGTPAVVARGLTHLEARAAVDLFAEIAEVRVDAG